MTAQSHLEGAAVSLSYGPDSGIFNQISFSAQNKKIGLIGANGSGKSTLLTTIAGGIKPTSGKVVTGSTPYYMAQDRTPGDTRTVAQVLGIDRYLAAYAHLTEGNPTDDDFSLLEGNWDLYDRIEETRSLWFPSLALEKPIADISGGEYASLGLAYLHLFKPKIALLDEPSNNLDLSHRILLIDLISSYPHTLIIATHDRELLQHVDTIWELRNGSLTTIEGTYADYLRMCDVRQAQSQQRLLAASHEVQRANQAIRDLEKKQATRRGNNRMAASKKRGSKMSMNGLKGRSEASLGKDRARLLERKRIADAEHHDVAAAVEKSQHIRLHGFLDNASAQPQQIIRLVNTSGWKIVLGGSDRVALLGDNGVGKSTLLRSIHNPALHNTGSAWAELIRDTPDAASILAQNSSHLDQQKTVWEELTRSFEHYDKQEIFALLARLSFSARDAESPIGTLSGGERFRIALAKILLARPQKKLIVLDEPTNSLDLDSLSAVEDMLNQFPGALLVVSHDMSFLRNIAIHRWLKLTETGLVELVKPTDTNPL